MSFSTLRGASSCVQHTVVPPYSWTRLQLLPLQDPVVSAGRVKNTLHHAQESPEPFLRLVVLLLQDPVVFSGTVRDNLDPVGTGKGDSKHWAVLRQTGLSDTITGLVSSRGSCLC